MKYTHHFFFFLLFFFGAMKLTAQEKQEVYGVITNDEGQRLPAVHVMNIQQMTLTIADSNGFFKIPANKGDTLLFSRLGYRRSKVVVDKEYAFTVKLSPRAYVLNTVELAVLRKDLSWKDLLEKKIPDDQIQIPGLPNGKVSKIPIPLRSDLFVNKPSIMQMVMSPFSTLAYYTSKIEKQKRAVLATMKTDRKESFYREYMRIEQLQAHFPHADSAQLGRFMLYCNERLTPEEYSEAYYLLEDLRKLFVVFMENEGEKAD